MDDFSFLMWNHSCETPQEVLDGEFWREQD